MNLNGFLQGRKEANGFTQRDERSDNNTKQKITRARKRNIKKGTNNPIRRMNVEDL